MFEYIKNKTTTFMETAKNVHQEGNHRVFIMDKWFLISELENNRTQKVMDLILKWIEDPNCRAYDFCQNEGLNELEKAAFIYTVLFDKQTA